MTKEGSGWVLFMVKILTMSCLYSCYIYINGMNITIKQTYKLYISVLGVYILPFEWPCKIPEVYKAPRL